MAPLKSQSFGESKAADQNLISLAKTHVEKLFRAFPRVGPWGAEEYATALLEQGITVDQIEDALPRAIAEGGDFPPSVGAFLKLSFSQGPELDRRHRVDGKMISEGEFKRRLGSEQERFQLIRKQFVDMLGEEGVSRYVKHWLHHVCGWTGKEVHYLSPSLFEKPALFDLAEAGKAGIPKAVEIGKAKRLRV